MLFLLPIITLFGIVMSPTTVMAADDDDDDNVQLKPCTGGFEDDYFNFFIDMEKFSEECTDEDFDLISETIQNVITEIQECIPEYDGEKIDATVCPNPEYVAPGGGPFFRNLRRRRAGGTYSLAGAGSCRRCRRSRATSGRRELEAEQDQNGTHHPMQLDRFQGRDLTSGTMGEVLFEHLCAMGDSVAVDAAVASRAVKVGETVLAEIIALSKEKETKSVIDGKEADEYIMQAEKFLEQCRRDQEEAKAKAFYVTNACIGVDSVNVETEEEVLGFEKIADKLKHSAEKEAKKAQQEYYKVKEQKIAFKGVIIKGKFDKRMVDMKEMETKLKKDVAFTAKKLKDAISLIDRKIKDAESRDDNEKVKELDEKKKQLEEEAEHLQEEPQRTMRLAKEEFDKEYAFALGALEVEAANTLYDYLEAFGDLVGPALEERLNNIKFSHCFEGRPRVRVEVEKVEDKKEMIKGDLCPGEED